MTAFSRLAATVLIAIPIALNFSPASAQMTIRLQCGPAEKVTDVLNGRGMRVTGVGAEPNGDITMLWTDTDGNWFLVTSTRGNTILCGMTSGEGWQTVEPEHGEKS